MNWVSAFRARVIPAGLRCASSRKKKTSRPRSLTGTGAAAPEPFALPRTVARRAASRALPVFTSSKKEIACALPPTLNSNSSGRNPSTKCPRLSRTVTSVCTNSVLTRTTSWSVSCPAFFCGVCCAGVAGKRAIPENSMASTMILVKREWGLIILFEPDSSSLWRLRQSHPEPYLQGTLLNYKAGSLSGRAPGRSISRRHLEQIAPGRQLIERDLCPVGQPRHVFGSVSRQLDRRHADHRAIIAPDLGLNLHIGGHGRAGGVVNVSLVTQN